MPKLIGRTPSWLSRPTPGAKIFSDPAPQSPASPSKRSSYTSSPKKAPHIYQGSSRLIASRGSEIFTVVGNKIRWADLAKVKDDWEEQNLTRKGKNSGTPKEEGETAYRTLATPVYYQIRQLAVSPSGNFLAICTEHTVHVAILPPFSRLADGETIPLKLKTYQLGPTTHVIPESPLASVLWHPLAASTSTADCLVTVTAEAAVRVWELDCSNHWTFERPALAIDLRKLADGVSCEQDFEPSRFGQNRGFSVDDIDMEASASCFGGLGREDEEAWGSMTLWTAMRNGDVYALCPLLPSKWRPTATTIPSLSVSAVSRMATIASEDVDQDERRAADQQYEWVQEIDNDEPFAAPSGLVAGDEIRLRPQNPSVVPRLQGPFEMQREEMEDLEVSDIHVIAPSLDYEGMLSGEDDYNPALSQGMAFTTVCLACTDSRLHIALELEGVSGQWLPQKGRSTFSVPTSEARDLTIVETVAIPGQAPSDSAWPMITPDFTQKYGFFFTVPNKIWALSLTEWASRICSELSPDGEVDPGLKTRLDAICETRAIHTIEAIDVHGGPSDGQLSAPVLMDDATIGLLLLTCTPVEAHGASFDQADLRASSLGESISLTPDVISSQLVNIVEDDESYADNIPTRAPYAPSSILYSSPMQPYDQLRNRLRRRHDILTASPLKLSPAVLEVMASAHRTFSQQTTELEKAAAEIFRRCERLREELGDQVKHMAELAERLQHLNSLNENDEGESVSYEERVEKVNERQRALVKRYDALRRKVGRVGSAKQELSAKEVGWIEEVETLSQYVGVDGDSDGSETAAAASLNERYQTVSPPPR